MSLKYSFLFIIYALTNYRGFGFTSMPPHFSPLSRHSDLCRGNHGGRHPPGLPSGGGLGSKSSSSSDADPNDSNLNIDKILEDSNSNNPLLRKWKSIPQESREDIKTTVVSFLFAVFVRVFLFEPRFIPSLSMFPTFDVGDQLLVDKISKVNRQYQRRDVVVFNPSDRYREMTGNTEALIKRIIAVEGDSVEIKGSKVYVNGVAQEEPYVNENPDYDLKLSIVPKGMVLVLGDNRNHSFDSHLWGFLPEKNIIGRAVLKYWPPWRAGFIEGSI